MDILLETRNLTTQLVTQGGTVTAVDHVNLKVRRGKILALVGESGSGKSMTCASMLGLLPPNGRIVEGEVLFDGADLVRMRPRQLRALRGKRIGMVLQDAMTALNPLLTIGDQIAEVFRWHHGITDRATLQRLSIEALEAVRIPAAAERLDSYPFQFSGGMRQRVCIAINLACAPDLLICDEPTTALDVTVQMQILGLLKSLQASRQLTIVFVTHDLQLASQFCDDVAIMYAGRVVEQGPIADVFAQPVHPYTEGLLRAVPSLHDRDAALRTIPGTPPLARAWTDGCRFAARCPEADARCHARYPNWFAWQEDQRRVACWHTVQRVQRWASRFEPNHETDHEPNHEPDHETDHARRVA
ncbi:ABC transporter ATP-binding protein [Cupriavidus plantarum]|uniref:ABC transporter ATP-binding protein n=1 Tax=Cupriavidus plantarum TaxID=942865 RepID=UPI000E25F1D7|nr:ABC transporter ATP-binding protein [Cupriavidus plantarum]REE93224.1 peptide/nickel transport system ATP-binding protein/oligopeptide transport system ATP-binding protein [Cupriavidus plantarum]